MADIIVAQAIGTLGCSFIAGTETAVPSYQIPLDEQEGGRINNGYI